MRSRPPIGLTVGILANTLFALISIGGFPSLAYGEDPVLRATYLGLVHHEELAFRMEGHGRFVRKVGMLDWIVPADSLSTQGVERRFKSFCAEPLRDVIATRTYPFRVDLLDRHENYGLADDEAGQDLGRKKAKFLRELYARYYADTYQGSDVGPDAHAAFQTAVWEIVAEQEWPEGPMPLNLFTGTFQADYPIEDQSPGFVQLAQRYVTSLSGNDALFAEHPDFAGMEPTRLTGLPVAGSDALPQSQLTLRLLGGSSDFPGGVLSEPDTLANAAGLGNLGPLIGLGNPAGGGLIPGGPGGGIGAPVPGGGGVPGGGNPSNPSDGGGTVPPGTTPPITNPPGGGDGTGGTGGNNNGGGGGGGGGGGNSGGGGDDGGGTVVIPTPGGIALGSIAVLTWAWHRRRSAQSLPDSSHA